MTQKDLLTAQDVTSRTSVPEHFRLQLDGVPENQLVRCLRSVRWLKGRRVVCQAQWQGKEVYAKLFFGPRSASRDYRREVKGLQALAQHKIDAPAILFHGTADNGHIFVVLLETIDCARTFKSVWADCSSDEQKLSLLTEVVGVVAGHHNAGLLHGDLHLNNLVCANGKIYTLDAADIKIKKGRLNLGSSFQNLAQLLSLVFPENDRFLPILIAHYMKLRGLQYDERLQKRLAEDIERLRYKRFSNYVKRKIFRNCTEFIRKREARRLTIINRAAMSDELEKIIADPDATLNIRQTRMVKEGNSSTVWSYVAGNHKYIIKRYNFRGFWPAMKRCFRESNAARSWRNAHLLNLYGIITAKPIVLIEEQDRFFLKRAYLISEQLEGVDCIRGFSDDELAEKERKRYAKQIVHLFSSLEKLKIGHGDLKGSNIFLTPSGPCLIDLDSMRQYRSDFLFKHRFRRDIFRFMRNWQNNPSTCFMFLRLLQ